MPTPKTAPTDFGPLADELGTLEKAMAPHAVKLARIELLRKTLRAACPEKPTNGWTVKGKLFTAVLGACGNTRVIDFHALVKAISATMFVKFATCTLKDLEKFVAPAIVAAVVTTEPKGSRSLETFEIGKA